MELENLRKRFDSLSPRQKEVALLLVNGLTNPGIADCLDLTVHTVKAHRAEIMRRMEAGTFAQLVASIQHLQQEVSRQPAARTGPLRIIVVEDDPWYRDYLTDSLGEHNFLVTSVADGKEFNEAWNEFQPDIVILDIELGLHKEDGISIATRLLESSNCGVIMVTARGDPEDRLKGLSIGVDAYFSKPVNINELVFTLANLGRRIRQSHSLAVQW